MNALLDIYHAKFKMSIAVQFQYRASLVIWLIGMVLEPLIYLVVWTTVARSNGGIVGGYTGGDFAAYFIVLMMVNHTTMTWIMHEFEYRIRQGQLSPLLLKPLHPIHADIAENITFKSLTLSVMIPVAVILSLGFHPTFHFHTWSLLAAVPAVILAFWLRFFVEWCLALMAFWTTRTSALNQTYYVALLFLSGQVAPLSLFPAGFRILASVLPFRWMVAFPVELISGRLSPLQAAQGIGAQSLWLVASLGLLGLVWKRGIRRYSAVGS